MVSGIIRFDTDTGRFESAVHDDGDPVGTDYLITNGNGYIIHMKQDLPGFGLW